jgi:predicted amidohydrolase
VARFVNVAIGQLGPIAKSETRPQVVQRLGALMRQAHQMGCDLIVYAELAQTTFFPRWYIEDPNEIDAYFEHEMPGPETAPLFDRRNLPAPEHDDLSLFHNHLVLQAGAYQNGTWVVGVAKGGIEEGVDQIGGSCIVAPSDEIVAACTTKGDELALARCDLDLCNSFKDTTFNFDVHRQPDAYRRLVERRGPRPLADGTPVKQAGDAT